MSDTLPLSIQHNRRMEKWLRFEPDRTVRLAVGKVELGQGNVTALAQIAADELDVDPQRIAVLSGDTEEAPDEGQTTSSQSIEVSGRSVRLVSAELRARVLDRLARRLNCSPTELSVEDGAFRRGDTPTGHDYWNFATAEDFAHDIDGTATPKPHTAYRYVGKPMPRRDLPAKVSGAAFVHDMLRPDMLHARILRQPCRGARLVSLDESRLRRAERGDFRIVRVGEFVAFVGSDETVVQRAAAAAPLHANWDNVSQIAPTEQEAAWLVGRASNDRVLGTDVPAAETNVVTASYSRPYVAHASIAPSCALAEYRNGHLSVWSHTQGVYPLRAALSNVLGISQDVITVRHAHGAGCYGHNGADDVAVDAAVIAMQVPDRCIRVQWRREEEFGFEPLGSAMHVTLRAALDEAGKPLDWTADIWSATHVQRPSSGGNMLTHEALPNSATGSATDRSTGGKRRRRHAQRVCTVRDTGQAGCASSGAARAGAHLGAARPRRAAERVRDRVLHRRTGRTCQCRSGALPAVDAVRSARATADREHRAPQQLVGARAGGQRSRIGTGLGTLQEPCGVCCCCD